MKAPDIFEELTRKDNEIEYYKNRCNNLENQLFYALEELKKTQALLRQFLNENTPSSKLPFNVKLKESEKEHKPRGKPEGGNGGNKEEPKHIDREINAKLDKKCPRCGKIISKKEIDILIKYLYNAKIITEIIQVNQETYLCNCGEYCLGKHPELPEKGMIGYDLQVLLNELKFNFSGSYPNLSKFFDNVTEGKINFTPKAINDCIERISEKLEPTYDKIESKLKEESHANCDETGWPVNGVQWYLWMIVTMNFVFITIQNSRARRVLTDIFGEKYPGGIISDCYKVYREFADWYQKCWIHLLRKLKFECEKYPKKNIVKLYSQLKSMHREMADFLKTNPSKELRKVKKIEYEKKLNQIINYKRWCKEARNIIDNWLIAYRGHWLTAIEVEGISLDNSLCERKIRGSIGWRKMLGGHRTREGTKQYAIIETHRQTWRHNGKYPYNELLNFLKNKTLNLPLITC